MTNQEYEKKLQELQTEIDELKAFKPTEYKRWRAQRSDVYYYIDDNGFVGFVYEDNDTFDDYRYNTGNYFRTRAPAGQDRTYLLALQTIKDDAEGFVPDQRQTKWHGCYNYLSKKLDTDHSYSHQIQGVIYFETKKKLQHSQIAHEAEWLTVLGVEQ
jgi:hypothetical protein